MNNIIITTICLVILTGCAGYYSHFRQNPNQAYSFDGEDRNFNFSQIPDEEDVGSQEIISFDQ